MATVIQRRRAGPVRDDARRCAYAGWTWRLIFFQVIFFQSILFQSILVRTRARVSMNRKISSNPGEAVETVSARFGSRDIPPETTSMSTQATRRDAAPD